MSKNRFNPYRVASTVEEIAESVNDAFSKPHVHLDFDLKKAIENFGEDAVIGAVVQEFGEEAALEALKEAGWVPKPKKAGWRKVAGGAEKQWGQKIQDLRKRFGQGEGDEEGDGEGAKKKALTVPRPFTKPTSVPPPSAKYTAKDAYHDRFRVAGMSPADRKRMFKQIAQSKAQGK